MKRRFPLSLILFSLLAQTAKAQEISPDLKAFVGYGFTAPFPKVSSPTTKFKPSDNGGFSGGLKGGFSLGFPIAPKLAIFPGIYYDLAQLIYGLPNQPPNDYTNSIPGSRLGHLQVPLDLKIKMLPWLIIAPGLQAGYLISAITVSQSTQSPDIRNYKAFQPWDFGASLGMDFIFAHSQNLGIGIYGRYLKDLSNQVRRPELIPGSPNMIKLDEFEMGVSFTY